MAEFSKKTSLEYREERTVAWKKWPDPPLKKGRILLVRKTRTKKY